MWQNMLTVLMELEQKTAAKLNEIIDITKELDEAADRDDQVSMGMLISARQQPVLELQELRSNVELKRRALRDKDLELFCQIYEQEGPVGPPEQALAERVRANRRLLGRVSEMDRRINQRICREKSIYNQE